MWSPALKTWVLVISASLPPAPPADPFGDIDSPYEHLAGKPEAEITDEEKEGFDKLIEAIYDSYKNKEEYLEMIQKMLEEGKEAEAVP